MKLRKEKLEANMKRASQFSEKISNMDKSLVRLTKKKNKEIRHKLPLSSN